MDNLALIGKKIGMTRQFYKTGQSVPVTVLKVEKGRVVELITLITLPFSIFKTVTGTDWPAL